METKGRILVIDDEAGIRQGCCRVLRPQGFNVETAENFQEGLQKLQASPYDLILLDVMLPDGKGIDLLEPIRQCDPETVAVIITGYATVELAVDTIKMGAYNFISKPFTADLLLITVNQGLEKRRLSLESKRMQALEAEKTELSRLMEEAEKRTEFKSTYMRMIAHELRSPLSGAQSLVRTLLRGLAGELKPQQEELLARIEIRLNSMLAMINDILTLASSRSIEAGKPLEGVQVQPVVRQAIDAFAEEARNQQVTVHFSAPARTVTVMAFEEGLLTVCRNLLCNAIKYSRPGSTIEISLQKSGDKAQLCVADHGIGIPPEDLPNIWEEFFRARNAHLAGIQGTGLGLSIVRQYVERFGGSIAVESKVDQGTAFTVSLQVK